jgi:hypothetical protein
MSRGIDIDVDIDATQTLDKRRHTLVTVTCCCDSLRTIHYCISERRHKWTQRRRRRCLTLYRTVVVVLFRHILPPPPPLHFDCHATWPFVRFVTLSKSVPSFLFANRGVVCLDWERRQTGPSFHVPSLVYVHAHAFLLMCCHT